MLESDVACIWAHDSRLIWVSANGVEPKRAHRRVEVLPRLDNSPVDNHLLDLVLCTGSSENCRRCESQIDQHTRGETDDRTFCDRRQVRLGRVLLLRCRRHCTKRKGMGIRESSSRVRLESRPAVCVPRLPHLGSKTPPDSHAPIRQRCRMSLEIHVRFPLQARDPQTGCQRQVATGSTLPSQEATGCVGESAVLDACRLAVCLGTRALKL